MLAEDARKDDFKKAERNKQPLLTLPAAITPSQNNKMSTAGGKFKLLDSAQPL